MVRRASGQEPARQTTLVVDASPEFRLQCAAAKVTRLDGLLFTHEHADQCHGIDDVRAFAVNQGQKIPCWMSEATARAMIARFGYVFEGEGPYPAIAERRLTPAHGAPWRIDGPSGPIPVTTFEQAHGDITTLGYRFGSVAYSSDVLDLPEESFGLLTNLDLWIVDALRYQPHPTHAHLAKTLGWIERVRPRRAILTNLHVDLDYADLARRLPPGVAPAHDGLRLRVPLGEAAS
jgi:phosphoribosyl 1,2-cyclic phosphate phosphodiesterase